MTAPILRRVIAALGVVVRLLSSRRRGDEAGYVEGVRPQSWSMRRVACRRHFGCIVSGEFGTPPSS